MTGAAAMTGMTDSAEARLNDYLAQVRLALDGHPDVSPDEVAADILEHVDREFAGRIRPVTLDELETVLARLGPPSQWAHAGAESHTHAAGVEAFDWKEAARSLRRKSLGVLDTLWKGPDDWRLPYLAFFLTLLAPFTFGMSLIAAYFLGRATLELAEEKGQLLGARRWLVYPAIVAVSLSLLLALLFGPSLIVGNFAEIEIREAVRLERATGEHFEHEKLLGMIRQMPGASVAHRELVFVVFAMVGFLAAWWMILGLTMRAFPKFVAAVFHPLLLGCDRFHGVRLATCSGIVFLIWAGNAYRLWANAG